MDILVWLVIFVRVGSLSHVGHYGGSDPGVPNNLSMNSLRYSLRRKQGNYLTVMPDIFTASSFLHSSKNWSTCNGASINQLSLTELKASVISDYIFGRSFQKFGHKRKVMQLFLIASDHYIIKSFEQISEFRSVIDCVFKNVSKKKRKRKFVSQKIQPVSIYFLNSSKVRPCKEDMCTTVNCTGIRMYFFRLL